jgi:hypothetical protein
VPPDWGCVVPPFPDDPPEPGAPPVDGWPPEPLPPVPGLPPDAEEPPVLDWPPEPGVPPDAEEPPEPLPPVPGFPPDAEEPPVLDWPPEPGVPPDAPPWPVLPPEPLPPDSPSVLDEHAAAVIASMVTRIRHVDIRSLQARVLGKQVEQQWQRGTTSVTGMPCPSPSCVRGPSALSFTQQRQCRNRGGICTTEGPACRPRQRSQDTDRFDARRAVRACSRAAASCGGQVGSRAEVHREHAVQAGAQQRGVDRAVDVLDARVGVQNGPPGEDEMPASIKKELARRRGIESGCHRPGEDLPQVVVDDRVEIRPGPVEQLEDGGVDVPGFVGLGGPGTKGGFGRVNALPRPTPAALANEFGPGGDRGEDLANPLGMVGRTYAQPCAGSRAPTPCPRCWTPRWA